MVAVDLLLALKYLQGANAHHGEVVLANVFVQHREGYNFTIKLAGACAGPIFNTIRGEPQYFMPPEFWKAMGKLQAGVSTDLWQLGILMYELCTGTKPYDG